jgi:ABC-type antimicrobial peptide transport system permease subunit
VGVVGDVRQQLDQPPVAEIYVPMARNPSFATTWVVHTARPIDALARDIRAVAQANDSTMAVSAFRTLEEMRAATLTPWRVTASLIGGFALLALFITAAGIAGVIAFSVHQRTQEFGVRMALGAQHRQILGMVVRQASWQVALGLVFGLGLALGLATVGGAAVSSTLFGVTARDPLVYGTVFVLVTLVSLFAVLVPGRRATRVDPLVALRAE